MPLSDIKDAGALAGVDQFGVPWHGRIVGGVLYTGKLDAEGAEITRPWTQPGTSDCWLIRAPQTQTVDGVTSTIPGTGLPDPYAGTAGAARKNADALDGRELKNYALLSGKTSMIHGQALGQHRWLYIAPTGAVWQINFGYLSGSQRGLGSGATSSSLTFSRFGKLGGEHETKTITISVPGIGTVNSVDYWSGYPYISDIYPDGSKVVIGLDPIQHYYLKRADNPIGFLEIVISGSSVDDLSASVVVVSNADQTVGYPGVRNFVEAGVDGGCAGWNNQQLEFIRRWAAWYKLDGTLGFFEAHKIFHIEPLSQTTRRWREFASLNFDAHQIVRDRDIIITGDLGRGDCARTIRDPAVSFINMMESENAYWNGLSSSCYIRFYSKTMAVMANFNVTVASSADIDPNSRHADLIHKFGTDEDDYIEGSGIGNRLNRTYGCINPFSREVVIDSNDLTNFT